MIPDTKVMESPTFAAWGYPTDETLDAIKLWPYEKTRLQPVDGVEMK